MSLVYRDENDKFMIGPLTEEQYRVINDSLELAAAWNEREADIRIARTLTNLLPDIDDFVCCRTDEENAPEEVFNQLPDPDDVC